MTTPSCDSFSRPSAPDESNNRLSSYTALRAEGNRIVDTEGNDVVLRGVAVVDPMVGAANRHSARPSIADVDLIASEWNANIIRVPMHPDLMEHNPRYLRDFVDPLLNWAEDRKIYLLLGYHAHGNPITGQVEETPWGFDPPWNGNPYNPDLELALRSVREIASRYRDRPGALYSIFNEPAFISWRDWRPIAEQLIDTVRKIHPNALIMVSGVNFASELKGVLSDPIRRADVVYEIHPYPWVGESWKTVVSKLSLTYPVFLGEWGFGDEHPANSRTYGKALLGYCEGLGLGWTAWIWDYAWTPSMFASPSHSELTEFGALVKQALKANQQLSLRDSR